MRIPRSRLRSYIPSAVLLVLVNSAPAAPLFAPPVSYATNGSPGYPNSVVAGDVNGDGIPDLVTANSFLSSVSILTGIGDGTFASAYEVEVGRFPQFATLTDLNGDSKLDLVACRADSSIVSVRLNTGGGSFGPIARTFGGPSPWQAAAGDIDGNGKTDLAISHGVDAGLGLLFGNGDGTFAPYTEIGTLGTPYVLAIGDLDADHRLDVVTGNYPAGATPFLNGQAGLSPAPPFPCDAPYSVALGDLDGDGHLDFVAAIPYPGSRVSVARGKGDGGFEAKVDYPGEPGAESVAIADLDLDGHPDVVVADTEADSLAVRPGLAGGTLGPHTAYHVGVFPVSVAIADFDRDGRQDVAVANYFSNSVSVLLNTTTVSAPPVTLPTRLGLASVGANPFRGLAEMELSVPIAGQVRVDVLDVQGRRVATLQDGFLGPGRYWRTWDGSTPDGTAPPGLYFARLCAHGEEQRLKLARMR